VTDKILKPDVLPDHESAVRRMMADAHGGSYRAVKSLADARATPDGVVVLEGDYGGQIYVVVRASQVACSEEVLHRLLAEIDATEWEDPDGARVYYEVQPMGSGIPGGMGGACVTDAIWVHPRLGSLQTAIAKVLSGAADTLSVARE
jgi:hypothetical protein